MKGKATRSRHSPAGPLAVVLALAVTIVVAGCSDPSKPQSGSGPQPLRSPAALLNPPRNVPQDIEEITIEVSDSGFGHPRYDVQAGEIRLRFVSRGGGPHSVRIDQLMNARLLPVGQVTVVGLTATPGEYTMRLDGGPTGTAILNVRPVGGR